MDIINELPEKRFNELDDLLAFISIYDDDNRTRAYMEMLNQNRRKIKNKVCVEAGCGFGLISEYMAQLGAKKVYAVEMNPQLFQIARQRLCQYSNVELIYADILDFKPNEKVDVLVHELFGQMLYDEDIYTLDRLQFNPQLVLPDKAVLMGGCINSGELVDETVTPEIIQKLNGALVSGLFDDEEMELTFPIVPWQFDKCHYDTICDISSQEGDLLYMGLHILHNEQVICRAGECSNWSYIWTPRCGNRFSLSFKPSSRGTQVFFDWLK
ncbi:MAG TPA: methyltransferase domain-containing protein [bacterium]|nr:methyltransferase domain-containing protein [bacterium]HPN43490.1 methyltransferase domain-containing protein [bacterium]